MSDTIKIHPRWKWVAKNQNGHHILATKKPAFFLTGASSFWWSEDGEIMNVESIFKLDIKGDWRKSLRKIKDGKLVMP